MLELYTLDAYVNRFGLNYCGLVEGDKPTNGLNKFSDLPLNRQHIVILSGNDPHLTHADVKSGLGVCHNRCWNYIFKMLMSVNIA